jgi:hypothetical protein
LAVALPAVDGECGGEIISADSRQVYRRMDIGTGKDLADYTVHGSGSMVQGSGFRVQDSGFMVQDSGFMDFREVIHAKHPQDDPEFKPRSYWQVFQHRYGFQPNLSILDLLFCMGPEAVFYL